MKKQNERYKLLSEELNSIAQNNISEYDSKKAYKEGPRHEYLLCVLNDSIEEMFEKYRNNGNEIYNFLENNKTKQNLITSIGKDSKYDSNAIKVVNKNNETIGYVTKEKAQEIAPKLDAGKKYKCYINGIYEKKIKVEIHYKN